MPVLPLTGTRSAPPGPAAATTAHEAVAPTGVFADAALAESIGESVAESIAESVAESVADGAGLGAGWALVGHVADAAVAVVVAGPDRVRALHSHHPDLAVLAVVLVAPEDGGSDRAIAVLDAGADACVVRPSPAELRAHVEVLLRRRQRVARMRCETTSAVAAGASRLPCA